MSDPDSLQKKLTHLQQVVLADDYTKQEIHQAMTGTVFPKGIPTVVEEIGNGHIAILWGSFRKGW